ncbi:MAG TPA: class I SAM-dependent methyltransferase [Acidimicrobiales bacterium]|nr:class I SAM-dependent methyltransferase [Acidimicrobiales bacterium]
MATYEAVADEYDAARPSYPPGVYDALGALEGLRVLDVGAGTGIATRQLLERGAVVTAVDPGARVLARASARSPGLAAVVADGAALPIRDEVADLVCFAQSWHWLDESAGTAESHRVLRDGGRWAGWWSHPRADDDAWFDAHWSAIERACAGTNRSQRDTDWGATVVGAGLFELEGKVVVPWTRAISVETWMTDLASHSYIVALAADARQGLLAELRALLAEPFPSGTLTVPYETWLWIARKVDGR